MKELPYYDLKWEGGELNSIFCGLYAPKSDFSIGVPMS